MLYKSYEETIQDCDVGMAQEVKPSPSSRVTGCRQWERLRNSVKCDWFVLHNGAQKTGPSSRRPTWAQVSDSVQEIKCEVLTG